MTITSNSLRRETPDASLWVEMSRYLVDSHNALKAKKPAGWLTYAKGSRVWVLVRSRTWESTDGNQNMSLDALGIHADPLRSTVVEEPDETVSDLANLDDFTGCGA